MAIERSVSLRLPNEQPRIRVLRRDHNPNLSNLNLDVIGECPSNSASAPTLNLAYFGASRPPSLHNSKLDLAIENISGTLERGSFGHRQTVDLPARFRRHLLNRSLRSLLASVDKNKRMTVQPGLRMHLQPPIEEGEVFSDDVREREQDVTTAIKWLHQEILQMKRQDRALMCRLLEMRSTIHQLAGGLQTSDHNLSSSMTHLQAQDFHPLAADSWPLLGGGCEQPSSHQESRDMVQDFHSRIRSASIIAVMPAGQAAAELANREREAIRAAEKPEENEGDTKRHIGIYLGELER